MDYSAALFDKKITAEKLGEWRKEWSALQTAEEQQRYYDTVISPELVKLDRAIEYRHKRHRHFNKRTDMVIDKDDDNDDIEQLAVYNEDFDDRVHERTYDFLHELVTDSTLCRILKRLTGEQKAVVFNNAVLEYSVMDISVIKETSDRNIRKTKEKALRHIRGQLLPIVMFKYKIQTNEKYRYLFERGISTMFEERGFAARFGGDYADYYPELEINDEIPDETIKYAAYYKEYVMDFVEITMDYRAQEQHMRDNTARLRDEARRYKERMEKKRELQKQLDNGNIMQDDNSYARGVAADYAQDI